MIACALQDRLDALTYPPTHCYCVADMAPRGVLARRAAVVTSLLSQCTTRGAALEVGFNKGFFLHLFGMHFDAVDGCEPWREYYELVRDIHTARGWPNIRTLHHGSFADMPWSSGDGRYDFIFLGNCMHYLYHEAGDFSFLEHLADHCGGWLLIEGFTSLDGNDAFMVGARRKWPVALQRGYTDAAFMSAASPHFTVHETRRSPTDRDRRFMLLRKRPNGETAISRPTADALGFTS